MPAATSAAAATAATMTFARRSRRTPMQGR
jgi:hypothetical protein